MEAEWAVVCVGCFPWVVGKKVGKSWEVLYKAFLSFFLIEECCGKRGGGRAGNGGFCKADLSEFSWVGKGVRGAGENGGLLKPTSLNFPGWVSSLCVVSCST